MRQSRLRRAASAWAAVAAFAAFAVPAACGQGLPVKTCQTVIAIQNTTARVTLAEMTSGAGRASGGVVLFNMHDDENTSVEAARAVLRDVTGRLVELRHAGARNLAFRSTAPGADTARFAVDPNRIFTNAGAARTLAALSRADAAVLLAVRAFADTVLARAGLDTARTVVTLHNNTDRNYSLRSYLAGGDSHADAAAVHQAPGRDEDDFFFVTERALFDALAARGFNAVLQDNARVTDDGSLSVLAARRGQRYVNVEAEHGHADVQAAMIRALLDVLRETPPTR